jgi:nitroreductase
MDIDEAIKRRKMIREFQQDRQIPAELIRKLLKNAHRSASAGHTGIAELLQAHLPSPALIQIM